MASVLGKTVADYSSQLTAKIAVGATTATLLSTIDDDGVQIATGRYFITIDGGNSNKEHFSCTLTGNNLTALKSISRQGVETSGAVREHRVGATVSMTDFAHLRYITDIVDGTTKLDGSVPLEYDATPTLTKDNQVVTKKYMDDLVIAGADKATEAVYGLAKLSVAAVDPTEPIAVGDNDPRMPTADEKAALAGTGTPAAGNKFVTADTISKMGDVKTIINAGETITGATLPVPLFQNTTDGELYACDANDAAKLNFLGFGISDSTDGNPITLQTEGIVGGFTGLSEGVEYYVQDAVGTIGTAKGTYTIKVGIAISETEILIIKKERKLIEIGVATGTALDYVNDTSTVITHSLGVIPKIIKIIATRTGMSGGNDKASISIGIAKVANDGTVNLQSVSMINAEESAAINTSAQSTGIAAIGGATAAKQYGSLGTVTSTQMTITFGGTGYGTISPSGTIKYQWEVYAE